jgi:hypothetical protein
MIPGAAKTQISLKNYLKGATKNDKREIAWTTESTNAFNNCKQGIENAVRATAKLLLKTDASDTAIGAALEQLEDNVWRPV